MSLARYTFRMKIVWKVIMLAVFQTNFCHMICQRRYQIILYNFAANCCAKSIARQSHCNKHCTLFVLTGGKTSQNLFTVAIPNYFIPIAMKMCHIRLGNRMAFANILFRSSKKYFSSWEKERHLKRDYRDCSLLYDKATRMRPLLIMQPHCWFIKI